MRPLLARLLRACADLLDPPTSRTIDEVRLLSYGPTSEPVNPHTYVRTIYRGGPDVR